MRQIWKTPAEYLRFFIRILELGNGSLERSSFKSTQKCTYLSTHDDENLHTILSEWDRYINLSSHSVDLCLFTFSTYERIDNPQRV